MSKIFNVIENEIRDYTDGQTEITPGHFFSQAKMVKRINRFLNNRYESGNIDSQGNYKYWYDVISPRIDAEVKNIDFDTKDIQIITDGDKKDIVPLFLLNLKMKSWMRESEEGSNINDGVEEGGAWGNLIWKKVKGGYEQLNLTNLYIINQTARTLKDSPVIERHILTQSDLRAKKGIWDDAVIDEVIKSCGEKSNSSEEETGEEEKETPYYEIYERNGEVSLADLKESQGKEPSNNDADKYVLAKIIIAGANKSKQGKHILFTKELKAMPYKEYHRGRYQGRWLRKGIVEILMDIQVRANDIGNQVARALEFGARQNFWSPDDLIYKNILTDLQRGDIIRTSGISRIDMKMDDIGNYINEWNKLMETADRLCNTYEVVQGLTPKSGTPLGTTELLNQNANKFYDFIREKLALAYKSVLNDWVLPDLMREIKSKEILKLTGDPDYIRKYKKLMVESWYIQTMLNLGPHTADQANMLRELKLQEIEQIADEDIPISYKSRVFDNIKPRIDIIITGEAVNLPAELQTLASFIALESDPVRRTALIEKAMAKKGIDITSLPKSPPIQQQPAQPTSPNNKLIPKEDVGNQNV